jgi:hypothetical protein
VLASAAGTGCVAVGRLRTAAQAVQADPAAAAGRVSNGTGAGPDVRAGGDLEAQAPADREPEQTDRDYRELARPVVRVLACRCGQAECLTCRDGKWLAAGL